MEEDAAGGDGEAEKPKKKKKNVLKKVFTQCPPREKGRPSRRTPLRPPLKSGPSHGPTHPAHMAGYRRSCRTPLRPRCHLPDRT